MYARALTTEIDFISEKDGNILLAEVKSGNFNKRPKAIFEFDKKYRNAFSEIRKTFVNQSYFDFSKDMDFIPAYLW